MELDFKAKETISMQVRIIVMLSEICGLTQQKVTEILSNTNILQIIEKAYFMFHQEGDYANMIHVRDALSTQGYNIDIPPINSKCWRVWNSLE